MQQQTDGYNSDNGSVQGNQLAVCAVFLKQSKQRSQSAAHEREDLENLPAGETNLVLDQFAHLHSPVAERIQKNPTGG